MTAKGNRIASTRPFFVTINSSSCAVHATWPSPSPTTASPYIASRGPVRATASDAPVLAVLLSRARAKKHRRPVLPCRRVLCSDGRTDARGLLVSRTPPPPAALSFCRSRRFAAALTVASMDSRPDQHGCAHYRRGCRVVAPCCGEVFACRHCHNDAKNSLEIDPRDRHEIPRHDIKKVICSHCAKEQDVQQNCSNCGACMGKYFCEKCKFFDDDVSKNQYHCDGCGICRTGGADNFFHCDKCGCCYSNVLKDSHHCVERAMHHNCPICFEYLFDSTKDISVLQCGHTIHLECMNELRAHHHFSCPVCSRSSCDMSVAWRKLDEEVAATPMPEIYQKKMVWILCNDCSATSSVRFHVLGHKCPGCSSYNTRETRRGPATACSRG